ncbi:hypothetical protein [Vibrio sp. LaRot3]|uniref:hypothetical protein n=1 Tax=Vibrio sp. LaRot3 TaxID=2998829 RepID=UPI0022CE27B2|nr:hypothetical protein [Vibrio sp. LaRot3]MDA0147074.1 hypothetical protein [Vibrio sp. LaRot3]
MQPRWLVNQLEELDYQTDYQLELITSLLQQAQAMHALTQDYIGLAKSDVFACHELYDSLEKGYQAALEHAQTRHRRVEEQVDHAIETETSSTASLEDAHNLRATWSSQTDKAQAWYSRADNHFERCEREMRSAERDDNEAQSRKDRAYHALQAARSRPPVRVYVGKDSNGRDVYRYDPPDTHAEEMAYSSACAHASHCRSVYNAAVAERNAALKERNRAQAQLQGARVALSEAKESVVLADHALQVANDGKRQANYSHDFSKHCLQVLDQVKALLGEFKKTLQEQTETISKLESDNNQAFLQLRNVENHHESIQGEAFSLKYTLQDKVSLLIAFDQPLNRR